ncbi:MAG: hypothetical protein Q9P01_14260 [Anaerolineae bacterium]|nr:hypothetical protein [Anaerolineae bacterium]
MKTQRYRLIGVRYNDGKPQIVNRPMMTKPDTNAEKLAETKNKAEQPAA